MPPRARPLRRKFLVGVSATVVLGLPLRAHGQALDPPEAPPSAVASGAVVHNPFIQYGVSFSSELVAAGNALCNEGPKVLTQCILGSGAGLVFPRIGWRSSGHWFIGGAYEFSKQDAGTVYLLPILQQLRGEARYYFFEGSVFTPFLEGSLGIAGYGNEWTVDSYGPAESVAIGVEAQISRNTVVGATFAYRLIHFSGFTDSAEVDRPAGFAQFLGLNLQLEVRDPY